MRNEKIIRKFKTIPFLTSLEVDRRLNLKNIIYKAKLLKLNGFEFIQWNEEIWEITSGRLLQESSKNIRCINLRFLYSSKLGNNRLGGDWEELAKALVLLRLHSKQQNLPNQRGFITAISYVAYAVNQRKGSVYDLNKQDLDLACDLISKHYSESTAYNYHKHVGELAGHLDANGLCKILLNYKYPRQKRPNSVNSIGMKRLDDPGTLETRSRVLVPKVFQILGQLYLNVPKQHKYRFYILLLTFFACTGRRFSELSLLPYQKIQNDSFGRAYLEYFPRKTSKGNTYTPKKRLYLPSQTLKIIKEVITEVHILTDRCRDSALEMHRSQTVDLRFLEHCPKRIYKDDLRKLGINPGILNSQSRLTRDGLVFHDFEKLTYSSKKPTFPICYTTHEGLIAYCNYKFNPRNLLPIHIDQFGKKYFLYDLMFLRYHTLSGGQKEAFWLPVECTHAMFSNFLRYIDDLVTEYVGVDSIPGFTSHDFRHTLNTMLDEGGLTDLLQTEWFGRSDPKDTKAYQHTSPEKKALIIREQLKKGDAGGILAEQIINLPIGIQDAVLQARVQAVHDVGTGLCIHNFSQLPCERHLQCSAGCEDYVWIKDDKQRLEEQKRILAVTVHAQETVRQQKKSKRVKKSLDWELHNEKKITVLTKQLQDNGLVEFDPKAYLEEISNV